MILIYTFALVLLGATKLVLSRRANRLESRFAHAAAQVLNLVNEPAAKPGNGARADVCSAAKRSYDLARLVLARDALEAKYYRWRGWADRVGRGLTNIREWKGRKLPYTSGVVDVWLVLSLIDYAGVGQYLGAAQVVETVRALLR